MLFKNWNMCLNTVPNGLLLFEKIVGLCVFVFGLNKFEVRKWFFWLSLLIWSSSSSGYHRVENYIWRCNSDPSSKTPGAKIVDWQAILILYNRWLWFEFSSSSLNCFDYAVLIYKFWSILCKIWTHFPC